MTNSTMTTCQPTKRELEILNIISYGLTIDEISTKLFISRETVKTHRKHLLRKFNARNTAQLIRKGFENQLLSA